VDALKRIYSQVTQSKDRIIATDQKMVITKNSNNIY